MSSNTLRSSKSSRAISDLPSYNSDSSVGAKLRRLRLEENVLINLLHSTASEEPNNESKVSLHSSGIDFNNFANKLKGNLNELKKIFEDIKDISNEDNLKEMDVDDIRKDVMDLDSNIGSLKTYLNAELISLRSNQEILEQQIEECAAIPKSVRRRGSGTQINKQFVVSPVKNLMTTPLKCMEVQQFQDFMANSSNRYGGWNEYNHLIFVNVWNKTFGENLSVTSVEDGIESSDQFPLFLNEVVQKVLGSHEEDIIEHTKWYSKYLFLKESQQKALLKWKTAKNIIRKGKRESSTAKRWSNCPVQKSDDESMPGNSYEEEVHASSEEPETFIKYIFRNKGNVEQNYKNKSLLSNYEKLNYLKPTKQWTSRSSDDNSTDTAQITYCNIEVIPKMATPNWRLGI